MVAVSDSLHLRIVDLLEEEQAVEPVARRRAVLLGVVGVLIVAALAAFIWVRADALAVAQPTLTELNPPAGAKEVPVWGAFRVSFGKRPVGTPTLRLEPSDGRLESARWDGNTLLVGYSGLRLATRYELVLAVDYRSQFKDIGHLVKRWSFIAEGYPSLVNLGPPDGETDVARTGVLAVNFTHRPPVDPQVQIAPADGTLEPGRWSGSTWFVSYAGLKARTKYQATAVVDYGLSPANIRSQWAFTTEPGAPPGGTPVIWYSLSSLQGVAGPQRLIAIDWTGTMVGTMYQPSAFQQSPDGSILATRDGAYFDRTGAPIRTGSEFPYHASVLADDNRSLCELRGAASGADPGEQWIFVGRIDGPSRRVALAGVMSNVMGARSGFGILTCSVLNDRVVLAEYGRAGTSGVRVLALSSGRTLYQRAYLGAPTSLLSSQDGKYLAEQSATYDTQGQPLNAMTVIRRTSDGKAVARLDKQRIVRFSWDDMRVVAAPFSPGTGPNAVELIEWQTGKTIWRQPGISGTDGGGTVYAMPQPKGPSIAIALTSQAHHGDVDQLWIVDSDGQSFQVVNQAFFPAFYPGF
jgi:hypothetical protein